MSSLVDRSRLFVEKYLRRCQTREFLDASLRLHNRGAAIF